ncbi:hypothetical protein L9F63_000190, partial [Diploptera punctata]
RNPVFLICSWIEGNGLKPQLNQNIFVSDIQLFLLSDYFSSWVMLMLIFVVDKGCLDLLCMVNALLVGFF